MTRNEILRRYPNASESFIRRNLAPPAEVRRDNLPPVQLQAAERKECAPPLDGHHAGKTKSPSGGEGRYCVEWFIYSCQPMDYDNANASIKEIQDEMVRQGWLPSDDWKTLIGVANPMKVWHRSEQRTEVRITRIQ